MAEGALGALPDGIHGAELDRRITEATEAIRTRLADLREKGLITPEEYEAKKRDLLERM